MSETRSRTMRAVKSKETGLEIRFRRALWAAGLRGYRKNVRGLPGTPDVVFGPARLAIFVHGCFWHRCPHCRPRPPKTNVAFWTAKFDANEARDARQIAELTARGYRALTVWECEMRSRLPEIVDDVRKKRNGTRPG